MRITEVTIKKFRSIKEAKFKLKDITAIVGENNAGKTAVLRALNSVFNFENEEKFFLDQTHQYAKRSNTHITVKIENIPNEAELLKYAVNDSITIQFVYKYSDKRRDISFLKNAERVNSKASEYAEFFDCLNKYLLYVYIPAERTNTDITWGENTIFKKLVTSYLNLHTQKRDTISSKIKRSSEYIHSNILSKLENDLSLRYMQKKNINFKIDFPNDIDYSSILDLLQLSINESGTSYLLKEWGSGTKSLAIIAMHRTYSLIEKKKIILGIEEPETNLHPQAQKRFIQALSENMSNLESQTIFTTHSTVLVDELKHEDILLVKRVDDNGKRFRTIINQVSDGFLEKYGIEESSHYNFFSMKNSEFFFSKHVIVCESSIDSYVIKKLISPRIGNDMTDVSFLSLDGVRNIAYPYFLLKELSIPFSVVVDYDFFFDYKNGELKTSRDKNGCPLYKDVLTSMAQKRKVIDDAFGKSVTNLEGAKTYRDFFEVTKSKKFYSMRYCLEIDLVGSRFARERYYNIIKMNNTNNSAKNLLETHYKMLKKRENLLSVIEDLPPKSYPESFTKIRDALIEDIQGKKGRGS